MRRRCREVHFKVIQQERRAAAEKEKKLYPLVAVCKLLAMAMIYYFTQDGTVMVGHPQPQATAKAMAAAPAEPVRALPKVGVDQTNNATQPLGLPLNCLE